MSDGTELHLYDRLEAELGGISEEEMVVAELAYRLGRTDGKSEAIDFFSGRGVQ
jgi:hypothetical protein